MKFNDQTSMGSGSDYLVVIANQLATAGATAACFFKRGWFEYTVKTVFQNTASRLTECTVIMVVDRCSVSADLRHADEWLNLLLRLWNSTVFPAEPV